MNDLACLGGFERFVFFVGAVVIACVSGGVGGLLGQMLIQRFRDD